MLPDSPSSVRPSAIAGTWYPGSSSALRQTVNEYLAQVPPLALPGRLLALVSPHAGYAYSGPTAAHAYAQLQGASFRRVVLLGPLHRPIGRSPLGPFNVPLEGAYQTPLGDVPLDRDFIARLGEQIPLTFVQRDQEHALEIQLPFLQVALGDFSLVPLMLGDYIGDPSAAARLDTLADALALMSDDETVLVASTDLSHLHDYAEVVRVDRRLVDLVAAFDVPRLQAALAAEQVQACGATALVTVLRAAQQSGAGGAQVLAYATSGDVTGDKRPGVFTVGYLAVAVYAQ
jgi:MEMO1 family protein